jgi:hypothetical protein
MFTTLSKTISIGNVFQVNTSVYGKTSSKFIPGWNTKLAKKWNKDIHHFGSRLIYTVFYFKIKIKNGRDAFFKSVSTSFYD